MPLYDEDMITCPECQFQSHPACFLPCTVLNGWTYFCYGTELMGAAYFTDDNSVDFENVLQVSEFDDPLSKAELYKIKAALGLEC